jgi:hypothetical protein
MADIRGYVRDAGGGVITIVIDRDTESYPPLGARVVMSVSAVAFPENANYGCVNCGSINHTTGDKNWCPVERE